MKVYVVAMPWQDQRTALQAVVGAAAAHGWELTVASDLVVVPLWARHNYRAYVPSDPLPPCSLLVWLAPTPVPPSAVGVPWVVTTSELPKARWVGVPAAAQGRRQDDDGWPGNVLRVSAPDRFFQGLAEGQGAWPEGGSWTGAVLPGRLCPEAWWSAGGWRVLGVLGVERL